MHRPFALNHVVCLVSFGLCHCVVASQQADGTGGGATASPALGAGGGGATAAPAAGMGGATAAPGPSEDVRDAASARAEDGSFESGPLQLLDAAGNDVAIMLEPARTNDAASTDAAGGDAASDCMCVRGEVISCPCAGGESGRQSCAPDCVSYSACECPAADAGLPFVAPSMVTLSLIDALISPTMDDGSPWDGMGTVDPNSVRAVTKALGLANPYAAAFAVVGSIANDLTAKPDAFGTTELFDQESNLWSYRQDLLKVQDSYHPQWSAVEWSHVPVTAEMRIRIELSDSDISFDDPIGVIELNHDHVMAAARARTVYHVQTSTDAAMDRILFVGISVVPEN